MKDDHDYRLDDADPYMPGRNPYYRNSLVVTVDDETGRRLFIEQAPVREKTWRTLRWGKALQIWMPEGRDFRSPNDMPDGPAKSLWGVQQRRWLERGILERRCHVQGSGFLNRAPRTGSSGQERRSRQQSGIFHRGTEFSAPDRRQRGGKFLHRLRRPPLEIPLRAPRDRDRGVLQRYCVRWGRA